jgi:hypothetical protein
VTASLGSLEFEFDVTRTAGGDLIATYGQSAQGLQGLPLSKVSFENRTLTFVLLDGGAGGAVFTGEILGDGQTLMGDARSPMGSAPFVAKRMGDAHLDTPIRNAIVDRALEGTWTGSLDANGHIIGLILKVENRADGSASVTIAQADRPALQLPAALTETGARVTLGVKTTSASWEGVLDDGALKGTWTQRGGSLPLTFRK